MKETIDGGAPVLLASCDSHTSPWPMQLRECCEQRYLEDFDDYYQNCQVEVEALKETVGTGPGGAYALEHWEGPEHADFDYRIQEMDRDGIALEAVFHGTLSGYPLPFHSRFAHNRTQQDLNLEAVGKEIYNRWLAGAVAVAPERFIALAQVPMWDMGEAHKAVKAAADLGLRGVNFPSPRPGFIPFYDDPGWEPFWSTCEENGIGLFTHTMSAGRDPKLGTLEKPDPVWIVSLEQGGHLGRSALPRLVFGGVFERHPGLNIVFTEANGDWWSATMSEFDSIYKTFKVLNTALPKKPSEYCASNVFIGASFLAPFEAERAVAEGYASNVCWGRDFPHSEGTWKPYDADGGERMTQLQLRYAFSSIDTEHVRLMAGENFLRAVNIEPSSLESVVKRINAPTYYDLSKPLDSIPEGGGWLSFRTVGAWG